MSIRARAQEGTLTMFSQKDDRDCYRTRFGGYALETLRGLVELGHAAYDDERHCWVVSGRSPPPVPLLAPLITPPDTPLYAARQNPNAPPPSTAPPPFAP